MEVGSVREVAALQGVSVKRNSRAVALVLIVLTWCLMLLSHPGMVDVRLFEAWVEGARSSGLVSQFQRQESEYGPLSLVIITGFSFVTGGEAFWAVKISTLVATLASGLIVWRLNGSLTAGFGIVVALSVPSVALGFLDVLYMPFLFAMVHKWSRGQIAQGWVAFVIACLIKPSPLLLGPVAALFWLKHVVASNSGFRLRQAVADLGPAVAVYVVSMLIFGFDVALGVWRATATTHVALSSGAYNLPWLWTIIENAARGESELTAHIHRFDASQTIGWAFRFAFVVAYLAAMRTLWRRRGEAISNLLSAGTLAFLAYFMLNLGVHGNHLLLLVGWCLAGSCIGACQVRTLLPLLCVSVAPILLHYGFFDVAPTTLNVDNAVLLAVVAPVVLCLSLVPVLADMRRTDAVHE